MGHDGILFCHLDIMIYNINITRNGIVNCNFTDVLQMLTVHNSQQTTIRYATVLSKNIGTKTTHYENTPIQNTDTFFASYGDSPVYRCIPFTNAIHKIAVFYMFYDFPLPFLQLMCTMCCFNWK